MTSAKYITYKAIVFTQTQLLAVASHYACGILTSVLQYRQGIIDSLIDMGFADNTHYSAHARVTSKS
jgi:hypothetical protein